MKTDVSTIIIEPMRKQFEARATWTEADISEVLSNYVEVLGDYTPTTLQAAWLEVAATWTRTTWPPPGVFANVCREVLREQAQEQNRRPRFDPDGERTAEDEHIARLAERRGLNLDLMRRPHFWWCKPREDWKPEWRESEIPKAYRSAHTARQGGPYEGSEGRADSPLP